jgi:hypothetical protein
VTPYHLPENTPTLVRLHRAWVPRQIRGQVQPLNIEAEVPGAGAGPHDAVHFTLPGYALEQLRAFGAMRVAGPRGGWWQMPAPYSAWFTITLQRAPGAPFPTAILRPATSSGPVGS